MNASKQVWRQSCVAMRGALGEGLESANISVEAKVHLELSVCDRRTSTPMARIASGLVDGSQLRSIQCSTVITARWPHHHIADAAVYRAAPLLLCRQTMLIRT